MSVQDKILWQKWLLESNQASVIDLMLENSPNLTEEMAMQRWQKNKELKDEPSGTEETTPDETAATMGNNEGDTA